MEDEMRIERRGMLGLLGMAAGGTAGMARAQGLDGVATVIVPYAPGVTDREVRALAPLLRARLGQAVVVDNRAGAGGAIGARAVATAQPDGRTLLYAAAAVATVLPLLPNAAYAFEDLVPLARVTSNTHVLAARPNAPYQDFPGMIAYARANPEKVVFASSGAGTAVHLAGEAMAQAAGVKILHAPFQGLAPAMTAVLGGHADFVIGLPVAIMPAVRDGRLRAIVQFGAGRSPFAPDLPTLRESGVDLVQSVDIGLFAPRGLPAPLRDLWVGAVREAVGGAEFREFAARAQVNPAFLPPDAFAEEVRRNREIYRALIPRLRLG
jgi:tripartite-type tricarboxylate transporter receptor subunit TctC